ncbi:MAG: phage antirepressor KilAC domain-containing protein [Prevotella sp.]|jgi:hypothetical protein
MKLKPHQPILLHHPVFGNSEVAMIKGEHVVNAEDVRRVADIQDIASYYSTVYGLSPKFIIFDDDNHNKIFISLNAAESILDNSTLNNKDSKRYISWIKTSFANNEGENGEEKNPYTMIDSIYDKLQQSACEFMRVLDSLKPNSTTKSKNFTVTEIAHELGTTAQKLNRYLVEQGIQYHDRSSYALTDPYNHMGYTILREVTIKTSRGKKTRSEMVWTESGRDFVMHLYNGKRASN